MTLSQHIIQTVVNEANGINAVNLMLIVMREYRKEHFELFTHQDYMMEVDGLVKQKEILELEYIRPDVPYRTKSLYFPKGVKLMKWSGEYV